MRISAFGLPMAGRRPRMTRAHDRQNTLPQRRCTSCTKMPSRGNALSASCYTLTHDTDSYRPAAVLLYAAGRPLTRPGGRPQPLAAAYAPLTRSHTQARRHPRRAAPIAADAPPLQCVRLSTGARRCLERSLSLARAATRSRRSDHPQHPSRLEPRRPPSRRYTCADRRATRSCGRH